MQFLSFSFFSPVTLHRSPSAVCSLQQAVVTAAVELSLSPRLNSLHAGSCRSPSSVSASFDSSSSSSLQVTWPVQSSSAAWEVRRRFFCVSLRRLSSCLEVWSPPYYRDCYCSWTRSEDDRFRALPIYRPSFLWPHRYSAPERAIIEPTCCGSRNSYWQTSCRLIILPIFHFSIPSDVARFHRRIGSIFSRIYFGPPLSGKLFDALFLHISYWSLIVSSLDGFIIP